MRAGTLRHRARIEQKVLTDPDPETGDVEEVWRTLYKDVPVDIAPISAREFIASQSIQSQVTARIAMRSLPGIDSTCRFVGLAAPYAGRVFNIAGQLEDKMSGLQHITFPVTEGVNEG